MAVTAISLLLALLLDHWLGEPKRCHPLAALGWLAQRCEHCLNRPRGMAARWAGVLALMALVVPAGAIGAWGWAWLLAHSPLAAIMAGSAGLWLCVGWRSLTEHTQAVELALEADNLPLARQRTACLVSRDCARAEAAELRRYTLESYLENTSDAVVAPLFWFALAGLPGVLVYRISNTLDALWGHRSPRWVDFGWAAARWDDALNLLPARLTALAFAATGQGAAALNVWRRCARYWESPNAGPVIAAGAGALGLSLGGGGVYAGVRHTAPATAGRTPGPSDLERARRLVARAIGLSTAALVLLRGWL